MIFRFSSSGTTFLSWLAQLSSNPSMTHAFLPSFHFRTCVPPLTASLRRQYDKSTIDVDDDKDTATIQFAANERFSASDFRAAVERVRMRVVTIRLQACGTVDASGGNRWLTAGSSRFLVRSDRELPVNEPLCADGMLDTAAGDTPEDLISESLRAGR